MSGGGEEQAVIELIMLCPEDVLRRNGQREVLPRPPGKAGIHARIGGDVTGREIVHVIEGRVKLEIFRDIQVRVNLRLVSGAGALENRLHRVAGSRHVVELNIEE